SRTAAASGRRLSRDERAAREQVRLEMRIHRGVPSPVPLEQHREVLLLLVSIVSQDLLQVRVGSRVDALVVPVSGLQLLLHGGDRTVVVKGLRAQLVLRLVVPRRVRHSTAPLQLVGTSRAALSRYMRPDCPSRTRCGFSTIL